MLMNSRGGPPFEGLLLMNLRSGPLLGVCMLMNSRGGPPNLRGGPPLVTISKDQTVNVHTIRKISQIFVAFSEK